MSCARGAVPQRVGAGYTLLTNSTTPTVARAMESIS
jgi:hypothetical protein